MAIERPNGVVVKGDVAPAPGVLRLGPHRGVPDRDEAFVDAEAPGAGVDVVPSQREQFAASETVEDRDPEPDTPPVLGGDVEEAVDLLVAPRIRFLHALGLGNASREGDTCRRASWQESLVDGVGEGCS